jgi:N-acetylmuramoyl-L-alanine amidase
MLKVIQHRNTTDLLLLQAIHARVKATVLLVVLLLACVFQSAFASSIDNIRISKTSQSTRIVLDSTSSPDYTLFALNNNARRVIDIKNTRLNTPIDQSIFNDSAIRYFRHATRDNDHLRLVLDLDYQTVSNSFVLSPTAKHPHRLVIDLKAKTSTAAQSAKNKPAISTPKAILTKRKIITKPRQLVIAIDAGHGGKDPGAIGMGGTYEKKVVLEISQRLVKLINADPGMTAVMTRNSDYYVTLRGRLKKARDQRADLFLSIHADAVENRKARGSSVYILSKNGASSEAAKILAQSQNSVDTISGVSLAGKDKILQKVIVDLSQSATIDSSLDLAVSVRNELKKLGKTRDRIESAGFAVLKSPDIPSILVETAFISNPSEEKKLRSPAHQQKLAQSIYTGIRSYLVENAPKNTYIAARQSTGQHTVSSGETLSAIALRYRVDLDTLRQINRLTTDKIRVGQTLIIPNA